MTVFTCGKCGALCEKNATRCDHCGRLAPALFGFRRVLDRLFGPGAPWSRHLAMAIVIVYLAQTFLAQRQGLVGEGFDRLTPNALSFVQFGGLFPGAMLEGTEFHDFNRPFSLGGQWWRLITANFLHIGIIHLVFNVFALLQAGPLVERLFGPARFVSVFVAAGAGGMGGSLLLRNASFTAGASASLCGLIGAMIAYGLRRRGSHGDAVRNFAIQWGVYILLFGILVPNVNNVAHIGGAIAGFACALAFDPYSLERAGRESDGARLLGVASILIVLVSLVLQVRFGLEFQDVIRSGPRGG